MEQAFYRKYRPKDFDSVVGQDHITATLKRAIKAGRINHAYLFTGPKGVGKTSIARILAHKVNKLPYDGENTHLDIIEIDAASNRRIDEIRDLRDKVNISPAAAKYKVYIIDEVHMLTREAFNALLKTLEEPPAHCIFILATTEVHKLPETIISRTQRFEFKPVNSSQIADYLSSLAKQERISISSGALELLAEAGEGSFRDSIGYLDQLSSYGKKISEADVRQVLALPSIEDVKKLLDSLRSADLKKLSASLYEVQLKGVSAVELANTISKDLRDSVISGEAGAIEVELLKKLLEVNSSTRPYDYIEALLLESALERSSVGKLSKHEGEGLNDNQPKASNVPTKSESSKPSIKQTKKPSSTQNFSMEIWEQVLNQTKNKAASLYTALKLATPVYDNDLLTLNFEFPLHQKKFSQAKNIALLSEIIVSICGEEVPIESVVVKKSEIKPTDLKNGRNFPLHSISSVFGSAEMLET